MNSIARKNVGEILFMLTITLVWIGCLAAADYLGLGANHWRMWFGWMSGLFAVTAGQKARALIQNK